MFKPKITISKELYEQLKLACEIKGASSVDELAQQILLLECEKIAQKAGRGQLKEKEVEEIANSLKGLGYLE